MNYLVTGGTGFIGAHVVNALVKDGEEVVTYDVSPNRQRLEQILGETNRDRTKVVQGDITDLAYLIHICQVNKVEKIIHTAALLGSVSSESPVSPTLQVRINCEGTVNVLETARILGIKKVVLASSASVFGPQERYEQEYIPNDAPHYGRGIYAASKTFNEACATQYFTAFGLDTVALRFPGVYGPGHKESGGVGIQEELFTKPALGKPGRVPFDGPSNWLYVEDAARAMVMSSKAPTTSTRAFTVSGYARLISEVADYVKSLIPGADITVMPKPLGFHSKFDATPLKKEIGFEPEWTVEMGVKRLIEFIQAHNKPA